VPIDRRDLQRIVCAEPVGLGENLSGSCRIEQLHAVKDDDQLRWPRSHAYCAGHVAFCGKDVSISHGRKAAISTELLQNANEDPNRGDNHGHELD
jgi:hypothetical protein